MNEHERRVASNEAVFRTVNEHIESMNHAFGELTETMEIVCECGNLDCIEQIVIAVTAYEQVRSDSALFIVVTGHEASAEIEIAAERHDGYTIVRKFGEALRMAKDTDPRTA